MSEIRIWGKPKGGKSEVIDRASSEREARYLVREYQMAYRGWTVWAGRRDKHEGEDDGKDR